jgi:rhamnosyl/mannosyltransferase
MQSISTPKNTLSPFLIKKEKFAIFSCGRLVYYKGFHNLISAAGYLPDNCVIRIAGSGKLYDKLKGRIITERLTNKVILLGRISDEQLNDELQHCFLFCLPSVSRAEMYALVQIDAFSHGKPVISTNIPRSGVPFVNINGVTGFTVEVNNPRAIADKINLLLGDSALYEKMRQNALSRAKELTDKKIIDKYIELFENL